jgi:septal ring factor EnvC (AmiA/AmiB activator)
MLKFLLGLLVGSMGFLMFKKDTQYDELTEKIHKLQEGQMATKQAVLQAIADEKAQVLKAIDDFNVTIQELKDQIAAGNPVTAEDLDEIENAVHDIFVPVEK